MKVGQVHPLASTPAREDELVREALDGLFEIAAESHPASVQASLREQIADLPARECRTLVEELVDTDELADRVREQRTGQPPRRPPSAPDERARKVDEALEPLVALTMGEEGVEALEGMEDEQRFQLLFSSLGP